MGRKTFFLAKQQKHLQSTPLAEPIRTVYVLAMCAHFFAAFCWSQKKRLSTRRAVDFYVYEKAELRGAVLTN